MTEAMHLIPDLYPMKASDDDKRVEKAWDNPKYVCEVKYDGARYLIKHDMDGSVSVTSRQKSKATGRPVDKTENVPHLVEWAKTLPLGTVVDGEIVINDGKCTSSEVTKIMGAKPELALTRQKKQGNVQYIAYDLLYFAGLNRMNSSWTIRRGLLESMLQGYPSMYVNVSRYVPCNVFGTAREYYENIVKNNGEGVILKDTSAKYVPDKRPLGTWLKVKKYSTFDVVIMGFTDAEVEYTGKELKTWQYWQLDDGQKLMASFSPNETAKPITKFHYHGWIGAIRFGQYDDKGRLVEIGQTSGMDEEARAWFTKHKQTSIGLVMEIGGMERIKETNAIRHPVFLGLRPDKNAEDCKIGEC